MQKPSVLAVSRDTSLLKAARLEMPLLNMRRQGLIENYFITNPTLFDVPDDFVFDVVWLQRPTNSRLVEHLEKKISSRYLVDLDDLLIGRPSYISSQLSNRNIIIEAMQRCQVLTVTSRRLADIFQKYISVPIIQKVVVCPNAFEFPARRRVSSQPEGIILTSSDHLALVESRDSVMRAVIDFSKRHKLSIHYFGDQTDTITSWFENAVCLGRISYFHYHALLESLPPMIGIAPLETMGDQETLEFVKGKSDIKMVDFGGAGHPSVYSGAPPYVDTDLKTGIVVDNTTEGWTHGLNTIYEHLWKNIDREQEEVIELRHMNRIARECWYNGIIRARLAEPMKAGELKFSSGKTMFFVNAAKHMIVSQDGMLLKTVMKQMPPSWFRFAKRLLS